MFSSIFFSLFLVLFFSPAHPPSGSVLVLVSLPSSCPLVCIQQHHNTSPSPLPFCVSQPTKHQQQQQSNNRCSSNSSRFQQQQQQFSATTAADRSSSSSDSNRNRTAAESGAELSHRSCSIRTAATAAEFQQFLQ